jgi:hypothetical protein
MSLETSEKIRTLQRKLYRKISIRTSQRRQKKRCNPLRNQDPPNDRLLLAVFLPENTPKIIAR